MVCCSRGKMSVIDPTSNPLWDENKTREVHKVGCSCVILVTPLLLEIHNSSRMCLVEIEHIDVLGVSLPEE